MNDIFIDYKIIISSLVKCKCSIVFICKADSNTKIVTMQILNKCKYAQTCKGKTFSTM